MDNTSVSNSASISNLVTYYTSVKDKQGFNIELKQFVNEIKSGKHKKIVEQIRSTSDKKERSKLKILHLPGITVSGVFPTQRNGALILKHTGLIQLDFDNTPDLDRVLEELKKDEYTFIAFVSPSGNGIKLIVKIEASVEGHLDSFLALEAYYKSRYNLQLDKQVNDLPRLCFVSYDPNLYINDNSKTFVVLRKNSSTKSNTNNVKQVVTKSSITSQNDIEQLIEEIERLKTDITEGYENYRNIGFALADEFGEKGRNYFHRICNHHLKYDFTDCEKDYNSYINSKGSGITISTIFYLAAQAGITLNNNKQNTIETRNLKTEEIVTVPKFPDSIYQSLPPFFKQAVLYSPSRQEKDMLLLGTLACVSGCLPTIYGIYDNDKVYSNLYLFVTAPASAGKGKLKWCKSIVYNVHLALRQETKVLKETYEDDLVAYNKNKNDDDSLEKPQNPPEKMLFIPANNSTTGVFQLLADSEARGIIFETEGDTLSHAFKTDYGNYSDGFRKAFHHETISYYRRTDREYIDMENPCLSTVLSGTPRQVLALTPNAENGLFSRFIFYYLEASPEWKNVFLDSSMNGVGEHYQSLGDEFFEMYNVLKGFDEIKIELTKEHEERFNVFFERTQKFYSSVQQEEYIATVRRMGLIAFRFMMIFTAFRITEDGDMTNPRVCLDDDFDNALAMVKVLIKHSSKVFSSLKKETSPVTYGNRKENFLNKLPHKFTTQQYIELAKDLNIKEKTAEGYITEYIKNGLILRESQGHYSNATIEEG